MTCDVAVVGGGIVGLATAVALLDQGRSVLIVEKENSWASHQTGHNSGVIHSGIYYTPGSLKARFAREGARETVAFCKAEGLPVEVCGKLIVATCEAELPALERLAERGRANGVTLKRVDGKGLREYEPNVAGIAGLHVADTGICDFTAISRRFAKHIESAGAEMRLNFPVQRITEDQDRVTLQGPGGTVTARQAIVCAGLQAGRLDPASQRTARIVPFRGEYYTLRRAGLIRNLVYPVPDPAFPFLGVHLTRMIDGSLHAGPNAVLALAREGYRKSSVSLRDLAGTLGYPGFRRLARKHWRMGSAEIWRSFSRHRFAEAVRRLVPEVRDDDLRPAEAGIRAQAVTPAGGLVDDFMFARNGRVLHVLNAPSPAATAALPIGRELARRLGT